jgi:hypothetical protein
LFVTVEEKDATSMLASAATDYFRHACCPYLSPYLASDEAISKLPRLRFLVSFHQLYFVLADDIVKCQRVLDRRVRSVFRRFGGVRSEVPPSWSRRDFGYPS